MFEILAFDPDVKGKWWVYEGLEFGSKEAAEEYLVEQFGEEALDDDNWMIRKTPLH